MSKRIIYLLLAVSLGLNLGVIATTVLHRTAGPPGGPRPDGGRPEGPPPGQRPDPAQLVDRHVRGMTAHLGLNEEQQQGVREILEHYMPQQLQLRDAAADAGSRLAEAFASADFDGEDFLRLTAETSAARSRLDSLSAVMLVAEAALLTSEQRLTFSTVAPVVYSQPQDPQGQGRPPRDGGPPPDGRPPRGGDRPPR